MNGVFRGLGGNRPAVGDCVPHVTHKATGCLGDEEMIDAARALTPSATANVVDPGTALVPEQAEQPLVVKRRGQFPHFDRWVRLGGQFYYSRTGSRLDPGHGFNVPGLPVTVVTGCYAGWKISTVPWFVDFYVLWAMPTLRCWHDEIVPRASIRSRRI